MQAKYSLKRQLLLWLLIPQLVLWLAGALLSFQVASHFANEVIDNSLLQLANSLARQVHVEGGKAIARFPEATHLLLDTSPDDQLLYAVSGSDGQKILGNFSFPAAADIKQKPGNEPVFSNLMQLPSPVRMVSIYYPLDKAGWIHIEAAKSLASRNHLSRQIMLTIALPLGGLLVVMSFLVWLGINRGLRPLNGLQRLVEKRSPQDQAPFELSHAPQELHALAKALTQLLSTTHESVARQRRFIADAAHQLRTPLAGLKSQTELAMRETEPEQLRARLHMVHTSATRSIHLVNQLLTLARSEPGTQSGMPRVKVDLARLIRDLTAESVPRALAAGMDLGCDTALNEAVIEGNSALLRELFVNLVENAIKYIPRGGNITVRLTEDDTRYVVEVEDSGSGIPDDDKPRVFERFYRREQTGNGCGLGMAIVKEIAERHGGSVSLLDAKPHGLIVHVELPKEQRRLSA
ncbi:sensor histidine kinase [Silvimonas amylolytica]|uniref:histidine kinase n=1 Tax=Silvimonas amylolytica TaxID=449663 RepID=A0ABQ2PQI5_9NEIS|nr:ATP-binding protein [Silvimonas amylolytica]GGP27578.1 sensor histidine kinase [Silvimonas amylolytica]